MYFLPNNIFFNYSVKICTYGQNGTFSGPKLKTKETFLGMRI